MTPDRHFERSERVVNQSISWLSGHPERDPEASAWIPPAGEGVLLADHITGSAFQATVMHEGHFPRLFIPGVTGRRTAVGAGPLITLLANGFIEDDVRITIHIETGIVENLIQIDFHRALHPL
jgi:hypothetical protein